MYRGMIFQNKCVIKNIVDIKRPSGYTSCNGD